MVDILYKRIVLYTHEDKCRNQDMMESYKQATIFLTESYKAALEIKFNEDMSRNRVGRSISLKKDVLERVKTGDYLRVYYDEMKIWREYEESRQKEIASWLAGMKKYCSENMKDQWSLL